MVETLIGGRYQMRKMLGSGGMGTVFEGLDTQTNQVVAIKQLKSDLTQPEIVERFKREGEALRDLNHPNIVKMLDAIDEDDHHYLIMEYVGGGDLKNLLEQSGAIEHQRCVDMSIDLADALTRAHRLNIIHRDLKPANILIDKDDILRLTDFGVAHVVGKERVTDTDAIVGTVDYLAPETLNGEPVTPRTDIWSFGVMLFEMLTGKTPFASDSLVTTIRSIITDPIPDLENLCPDAPIALIDLIYRMLEKDPNARIRSVRRVGLELEEIIQGVETASLSSTGKPQSTRRFATPTPDFDQRIKHNLPAQTTPFVGREHELAELETLINDPKIRLITILAPGGMGKSRLALEMGERIMGENTFTSGVWFVDLAPLSSLENIPNAIATAVGFQFMQGENKPKQQVLDYLSSKNMLLIMDNYEHLLDGAEYVTDILQAASDVIILATSRQRLSQPGEALFHLSGMNFPDWEIPKNALDYAVVKLFMNSAKRTRPDFDLTIDNIEYVVRICKLVQGMPLGIVLAAAWLNTLSIQEIAEELQQNIDILEDGAGQVPERQRSIRAVMDYSWDTMTEEEQQVFMELSVFRDGFTREAAQNVTDASLRQLMSLVNKSLIRRDTGSGRYYIHELLRQYAEEQLQEFGNHEKAQYAHANYYNHWMEHAWPRLQDYRQIETLDAIDRDYANVRTAWLTLLESGHGLELRDIVKSLQRFILIRNRYDDGLFLFVTAIDTVRSISHSKERNITLGCLLGLGAYLYWYFPDRHQIGKRDAEEALTLLQPFDRYESISMTYVSLALVEKWLGNYKQSQTAAEKGLEIARRNNSKELEDWNLWMLSESLKYQKKYEEALAVVDRMTHIATEMDRPGAMFTDFIAVLAKAHIMMILNQYSDIEPLLDNALIYAQQINSIYGIAAAYEALADLMFQQGQHMAAHDYIMKAITYYLRENNERHLFYAMIRWGEILLVLDKTSAAVTLLSCVANQSRVTLHKERAENLLDRAKDMLPLKEFEQARQQAETQDIENLVIQILNEIKN